MSCDKYRLSSLLGSLVHSLADLAALFPDGNLAFNPSLQPSGDGKPAFLNLLFGFAHSWHFSWPHMCNFIPCGILGAGERCQSEWPPATEREERAFVLTRALVQDGRSSILRGPHMHMDTFVSKEM